MRRSFFADTGLSMLIYAPVALWALLRFGPPTGSAAIGCVAPSGVLHLAYSLVLQRRYQVADLSVIYPVARDTGPTLSAIGAFALLGERATLGAVTGLTAVVLGILLLATGGRWMAFASGPARTGVAWGTVTGGIIAGYNVVDGWGAKLLGIHPVLLDWTANALRFAFLVPIAYRDRERHRERLTNHWLLATCVDALSPLGYILVLTALRMGAPLHVVAPAREISMMMGALLGIVLLKERVTSARLTGCAMIVAEVVLLAS